MTTAPLMRGSVTPLASAPLVCGALFSAQLAIVVAAKITNDQASHLLWISHVALLIGAVGCFLQKTRVLETALILILVPHAAWVVDWASGAALGDRWLGATAYLDHADALTWCAALHHFYLAPALFWLTQGETNRSPHSCLSALVVFTGLTTLGQFAAGPQENVNYAHYAPEYVAAIESWNGLPPAAYLLVLNALALGTCFLPAWCVLQMRSRLRAGTR